MDIVAVIAENKIREAIKKGDFDNLSGRGKPLKVEDLSGVPEELRASYIILKNYGALPPEMELSKEIVTLQRLVNCCYRDEEKTALRKKLNEKMLRFNLLMEKRGATPALQFYQDKIEQKLLAD